MEKSASQLPQGTVSRSTSSIVVIPFFQGPLPDLRGAGLGGDEVSNAVADLHALDACSTSFS
jgi:hypothetical protein